MRYNVLVRFSGFDTRTVTAANPEEAMRIALREVHDDINPHVSENIDVAVSSVDLEEE